MKWVLVWVEWCVSKKYHNDKYVQLWIPVLRKLVVASSTVLMAPCLKFEELSEVHSITTSMPRCLVWQYIGPGPELALIYVSHTWRSASDNFDHGEVFRAPGLGVLWKYTNTYVQPKRAFTWTVLLHDVVRPYHPLGMSPQPIGFLCRGSNQCRHTL